MQPLSNHLHKTLLPIGDSTILGRILDALIERSVTDITLVTGHRADDIRAFVQKHYPEQAISYVHNERYAETNNIVSLALALEQIDLDDDIILIESDLLFDPEVLRALMLPGTENLALVDRYRPGMDGTVVSVSGGLIDGVYPPHLQGAGFTYEDKYKTLNIYRFNKEFVRARFLPLLSCYANVIDGSIYYELVLGMMVNMQRERIRAIVVESPWAEVDDPNDLASARFAFEPAERMNLLDRMSGGHWPLDLLDFHFLRNMHFPSDSMMAAMQQALPGLVHSYGSSQRVIDQKLSYVLRCRPERVLTLHGASQVYPWIPALLGPGKALAPYPTFGEYRHAFPDHARYADAPGIDLDEVERKSADVSTIVFVNPNNPTGTTIAVEWLHAFAARHPDKHVVIDESFIDFSDQPSMVPILEERPLDNVLVLKSLSKCLGAPGLRLGFAYTCDLDLAAAIRSRIPIWNLGAPAEFFLELLLKFRPEFDASLVRTALDRTDLATRLRTLPDVLRVVEGGGDYVLVQLKGEGDRGKQITQDLLAQEKIYVKDVSERFEPRSVWLRLAVRLPHEHERLVRALRNLSMGPNASPSPSSKAEARLH
jgi:histidinol-phosphate/aromatic aminotransferase/cobyric acid decarboxylase-like protein/choline kinase